MQVRRCSRGPHPPSSWPVLCLGPSGTWHGQISALRLQSDRAPAAGAAGCGVRPAPCLAAVTVISTQHAVSRHISCANAVSSPSDVFAKCLQHHFLSLNICSCCKTTSKLRTLFASFTTVIGTTDFQRQEQTLRPLSEQKTAQFSCETQAICRPEQVCAFLSKWRPAPPVEKKIM